MTVAPRPRVRAAPEPPPPTPFGYPVIGGPRRPDNWPKDQVFPCAYYQTTEGNPIKQWPWRANTKVIGMYFTSYAKGKHDGVHVYRFVDCEWRYAGKVSTTSDARSKLEELHDKSTASAPVVQPVARVRVRSVPVQEPM